MNNDIDSPAPPSEHEGSSAQELKTKTIYAAIEVPEDFHSVDGSFVRDYASDFDCTVRILDAPPAAQSGELVAWVYRYPDGEVQPRRIIPECEIEDVRRKSGAWAPLYTHPQPAPCDSAQNE